jgi:hypothetical protein
MREDAVVVTMLVLTEKALLPHDVQRLDQLHAGDDDVRVHVFVPEGADESALSEADELVDDVARTDFSDFADDVHSGGAQVTGAAAALADSLSGLAGTSLTADGSLVPADPVDAVVAKAIALDADEVIVVTEPHWLEEVLRRDWGTRIYKRMKAEHREIPVLHFIAGTDQIVR